MEIFDFTVKRWRALGVAGHSSSWILAMGPEGDLWDVTGRYGRWSFILDQRGSLGKIWKEVLESRQVQVSGKLRMLKFWFVYVCLVKMISWMYKVDQM